MSGRAPTPDSSTLLAPASSVGAEPRLVPPYSWRVWLGWFVISALLAGIVVSLVYFTEGVRVDYVVVGVWVFCVPATVIYFELVNSRLRRLLGVDSPRSPGLPLAAAGLVVGWVLILLGPLVLVLAYLGWRRIRYAGVPYGAGAAAAAVAFVVGALGTVYLALVLAGVA